MRESESVYLDGVRFLAASCVVVNHLLAYDCLPPTLAAVVPDFGREAVITFFVLSGYVIAYSTDVRNPTLGAYATARAARIYSAALPILLLAFAIDRIAIAFNSEHYPHLYQYDKFYLYIPLHLAFLGEVWALAERPFTIPPYWSLSYEVWYYVLFGVMCFYSGAKRWVLATLTLLVMGYTHWMLFPIWMAGVALYRYRDRFVLSPITARCGLALTFAAIALMDFSGTDIYLWELGRSLWPFPSLPLGSSDQYLLDYVVGLLVVLNFKCARDADLPVPRGASKAIRAFASYTLTLYLVHTLVILTWTRNFPFERNSAIDVIALLVTIGVATWTIGGLTERRRQLFASPLARLGRTITLLAVPNWLRDCLRPNAQR